MKTIRSVLFSSLCLILASGAIAQAQAGTAATTIPAAAASSTATTVQANQTSVNINTATVDQFDGLKGIGPKKAQAIIDYRNQNGNFKSIDDLSSVKGISQKIIDENRDRLTLS